MGDMPLCLYVLTVESVARPMKKTICGPKNKVEAVRKQRAIFFAADDMSCMEGRRIQ